ncbi:MAG: CGNR zinc finger domain-containing protein, partial [Acidothermales bacterium]|nr:CGNR zinc finger domain-containing protein [Acidothermales bacterium]
AAEAPRLRAVFAAVDYGDADEAATIVNGLLTDTGARPVLSRHDDEPWHLHFHGSDGRPDTGWLAACATGLAVVLGGEYADRLGVCSAPACDRVYVDTSRNGTRRFCSTTCQNRVKAAAYRLRRQPV